jgi:hypothetical protein
MLGDSERHKQPVHAKRSELGARVEQSEHPKRHREDSKVKETTKPDPTRAARLRAWRRRHAVRRAATRTVAAETVRR